MRLLGVISDVVQTPEVTPKLVVAHLRSNLLQLNPLASDMDISRFKMVDFGTCHRFSQGLQQGIISTMKAKFPYLASTSNYDLPHQWDLAPVGTQAHECF